jgi:hypothetical protein
MTYEEALELIREHTDYGGSVDQYALAIAIAAPTLSIEQIASILACEIECGIFEQHVIPALDVARAAILANGATMDGIRMLIQRLAHSLRKASPDNALSDQAMDYLKRMGLVGTPLRDVAIRDAATTKE